MWSCLRVLLSYNTVREVMTICIPRQSTLIFPNQSFVVSEGSCRRLDCYNMIGIMERCCIALSCRKWTPLICTVRGHKTTRITPNTHAHTQDNTHYAPHTRTYTRQHALRPTHTHIHKTTRITPNTHANTRIPHITRLHVCCKSHVLE